MNEYADLQMMFFKGSGKFLSRHVMNKRPASLLVFSFHRYFVVGCILLCFFFSKAMILFFLHVNVMLFRLLSSYVFLVKSVFHLFKSLDYLRTGWKQ